MLFLPPLFRITVHEILGKDDDANGYISRLVLGKNPKLLGLGAFGRFLE